MMLDKHISDSEVSLLDRLSDWSLIVAVNNEAVLRTTLLASPDIDSHCQLIRKSGFDSAGSAYNSGLSEATSEVVVFAHQDVYLPKGWKANLSRALQALETTDPNWGVLGVFGVSRGSTTEMRGHCYSTGLNRVLGEPFDNPIEANVLDELLLVLRRSSGLRFDDRLPNFHLYGADICLRARADGMKCYIIPAFCIHNSNGVRYLPLDYWRSYAYMRRKWWSILPVNTCCSTISKSFLPLAAQVTSDVRQCLGSKRVVGTRCDDVAVLYQAVVGAEKHV
jgi:glycosyltransferase involved in cell wall biosynthesis